MQDGSQKVDRSIFQCELLKGIGSPILYALGNFTHLLQILFSLPS